MNYTRDDYRTLYNDDEGDLSDITLGQKIALSIIFGCVLATGFVEHEAVSVMQDAAERPLLCPRLNAAGERLVSSMVMETYGSGPKPHVCNYGSKG